MNRCEAITVAGTPCRARPKLGERFCKSHSPDPDTRSQHLAACRKGGQAPRGDATYEPFPAGQPIGDDPRVEALDLETAAGLVGLLGVVLKGLVRQLPLDTRLAHALAALINAQRSLLETSELEARLTALEATQSDRPHLRAS